MCSQQPNVVAYYDFIVISNVSIDGVINSVINGREIQIYELVKAFDALWLDYSMNHLYEILMNKHRDEKMALLYESIKKVAVNTAVRTTERIDMHNIVQQGGTCGPV